MVETTLTTIARNTASKLWNGLIEFGTISAAILGIFIILKLIKTVVDIVIQGYQLRETYECRIALLGAICGSVTHLLLYIKRKHNTEDQTTQPQGISITPTSTVDQHQQPLHPL
jgi:mannose/fructose/N-acetylgalactosamine-specific phosphotransferase system component IID